VLSFSDTKKLEFSMDRRNFLAGAALAAGSASVTPQTVRSRERAGGSRAPQPARFGQAGRDFPKVGGNLANTNYSSLRRIHRDNVRSLGGAWHINLEGGDTSQGQQSTIVAQEGVLYVQTSQQNVFAIDGRTGAVRWKVNVGKTPTNMRGVAVGEGLVFSTSGDDFVYALDRATGRTVWRTQLLTEAEEGRALVRERDGDALFQGLKGAALAGAIVYWDGLIYVGMQGSTNGARGRAYALDAKTGRLAWRFWGTPGPGEFGNDTWEGESWKIGGSVPWIHPSIDPELGLVYWTFGGPYPRTIGASRGGDNLFSNCIVALDAKTGRRRWHFQSVRHDIWDYDNVMPPPLLDLSIGGRMRKVVVYGSKVGHYFILDRVTGEPIHGVQQRPVPQERRQKTAPTQPFPGGEPFVHQQPYGGDSTRPVPFYQAGGLFTPFWERPTVIFPGAGGGADWAYPTFNPETGLLTVGYSLINSSYSNVQDGRVNTSRPYGEYFSGGIVAIDPRTNTVAWRRQGEWSLAHGNHIVTTAGGLMLQGHPDGLLHAMDARTGESLWSFQTGAGAHTTPITYEVAGEQYIAILSGGHFFPYYDSPRGDHLWAFKLGGTVPPAPTPRPPSKRREILTPAVEAAAVRNTVTLGRIWDDKAGTVGGQENLVAENAMAPQLLRVPAGTTVTFTNPAENRQAHGAVSFWEAEFDSGLLLPGQSYQHTFGQRGEWFYNDPAFPQNTGKVIVY
jgi:PQQ-dependent dehydrogenase (methanol/ethanol family)